jgi:hypothetical protein
LSELTGNAKNLKKSGGAEVPIVIIDPRKWSAGPKLGAELNLPDWE